MSHLPPQASAKAVIVTDERGYKKNSLSMNPNVFFRGDKQTSLFRKPKSTIRRTRRRSKRRFRKRKRRRFRRRYRR